MARRQRGLLLGSEVLLLVVVEIVPHRGIRALGRRDHPPPLSRPRLERGELLALDRAVRVAAVGAGLN